MMMHACINTFITNCHFYALKHGIDISQPDSDANYHEGAYINNNYFVAVNRGIQASGKNRVSGRNSVLLRLLNNHIDAIGKDAQCIAITNWSDVRIESNSLYVSDWAYKGCSGLSSSAYHCTLGIERSIISNNEFNGLQQNDGGIVMLSAASYQSFHSGNNIISQNIFTDMPSSYGIWFQTSTFNHKTMDNIFNSVWTNYLNSGAVTNTFYDN